MLTAPAVVTALAVVVLHQPIRPRFFFFLSGAAAICVGLGVGVVVDAIVRGGSAARSRGRLIGVIACTTVLVALSAVALPRNYQVPKQDFDGAVRFLEAAETQGARIAAAGPACPPLDVHYEKASWPCLAGIADWNALRGAGQRVLIVHTLTEYVEDDLRARLRTDCPTVQRFEGTLGGGDIIVCDGTPRSAPDTPAPGR